MMAENDYVDDVKNTQSLESLPRLALEICMSLDHGSFSSTQSWLTVRMRMPSTLSSAGSFSFSRPRARRIRQVRFVRFVAQRRQNNYFTDANRPSGPRLRATTYARYARWPSRLSLSCSS